MAVTRDAFGECRFAAPDSGSSRLLPQAAISPPCSALRVVFSGRPPLRQEYDSGLNKLEAVKECCDLVACPHDQRGVRVLVDGTDVGERACFPAIARDVGEHQVASRA